VTDLAYLADIDSAYVRSFRARVIALPPGGLVLEKTFFYPTGGGQPSDRGFVKGTDGAGSAVVEVVDVVKSGTAVLHRLRGPSIALASLRVGGEVEGTIDWERRHRHMRLHTGQHYLSARIFTRTGRRTRRAALKDDRASLDLDGPLPPGAIDDLRADMEELVRRPMEVRIRHVSRAEWEREPSARSGLVPLPLHVDPIRVVEIEGMDRCPCGGTHVRSTAEVGPVEILPPRPGPAGDDRVVFRLAAEPSARPTPPA
jgi:misacylated tRNA(Ala) deacylase